MTMILLEMNKYDFSISETNADLSTLFLSSLFISLYPQIRYYI